MSIARILSILHNDLDSAFRATEKQLLPIAKEKFKDFDNVVIFCNRIDNTIQLHKGDRWVRFFLRCPTRKTCYYHGQWNKTELDDIKNRINNLF
jgi:hypothetical protein